MRTFAITGLLLSTLTLSAFAGDFEDGVAAYDRGDYATALKLIQPLAELGDADAQSELGWMYDEGKGVQQDYEEAVKWYRLSANQGNAVAQYNLGWLYVEGKGVPQDYVKAVELYRLSAKQGDAYAQAELGWMCEEGNGVPQDFVQAYFWYSLAVAQGHEDEKTGRDRVAGKMTTTQIEKAQEMTRRCEALQYKNCD